METVMFRPILAMIVTGLVATFALGTPVQMAQADTLEKPFRNFNVANVTSVKKKPRARSVSWRRYSGARKSIVLAVRRHARAAGVPVRVGLAVVRQESNFRPGVRGKAGEIGLMQLKCATARGEGYRGSCRGLYKISTNLKYGMRYLRKALKRGSVGYYNAGIGAKRLPRAARRYARQVNRRL